MGHIEREMRTYKRSAVDFGGRVRNNNATDDSEPERILAVKVEERGPTYLALLHADGDTQSAKASSEDACVLVRCLIRREENRNAPCAR